MKKATFGCIKTTKKIKSIMEMAKKCRKFYWTRGTSFIRISIKFYFYWPNIRNEFVFTWNDRWIREMKNRAATLSDWLNGTDGRKYGWTVFATHTFRHHLMYGRIGPRRSEWKKTHTHTHNECANQMTYKQNTFDSDEIFSQRKQSAFQRQQI